LHDDGPAGVRYHRVQLDQPQLAVQHQLADSGGQRGDRAQVNRRPATAAGEHARAAQAPQRRLDPVRIGGERHDRHVVVGLGPDAAQADHERGHDPVGAGAHEQLDARRAHQLGQHGRPVDRQPCKAPVGRAHVVLRA